MPQYDITIPGKGTFRVESPTELTDAQAYFAVQGELGKPAPESTVLSELVRGGKQFLSSARTGIESLTAPEQAAVAGVERSKKISEEAGQGPSFAAVRKAYEEKGLLPAAGEAISQIPRALAGQGAQLAGMYAGAKAGALAGAAVPIPGGALIGGALGAGATLLPQFMGSNVERQAEAQLEKGEPVSIDRTKAYGAAAGQAVLEGAGTAFTLGKRVVKGVLGIADDAALATAKAQAELAKAAQRSLAASVGVGAVRGVVEIPVEMAQAVIERAQAGLDLTSPEALNEYGESAYGALLVGPPIGGVAGGATRSAARREVEAGKPPAPALVDELKAKAAAEAQAKAEAKVGGAQGVALLTDYQQRVADMAAQPDGYAALAAYGAQLEALPKSKERDAAIKAAKEARIALNVPLAEEAISGREAAKQFMTAEEAAAVPITPREELEIPEPKVRKPGELPQVLDAATIKTIGFTRGNIKNLLMGKDLTDPAQLQEVKDILEAYKQEGNPSDKTVKLIDAFLAKLPEAPAAPTTPETPSVGQAITEPSGVGVQVAGEPSAGAAPARVGAPEPSGVVPAVEDAGQPSVGEGVAPSAVTAPEVPAAPAPEAQVETPPTPPAVQAPAAPAAPEAPAVPAAPEAVAEPAAPAAPIVKLAPKERKNLIEQVERVSERVPVEEYDAFYENHATPDGSSVKNTPDSIKAAQDLIAKYSEKPSVVRPTPGTQTPEMVAAAQAGDTRAALRAIETAADTTPLDKIVAKRLQQLGSLPKMQVVPADQVQGSAMYDTNTDTVLIAEGQADSHTIGHEVTHSALHKLIIANEQGKRNDAGYRDLKTLFDYLNKNHPNLKDEYGMKTVSEFSAEAMSNPQFQKQLAKIPYKAQTAWQWFGQAVRKLLALPQSQGSALLEALTAVDKTLYEGREYQVRGPKLEGAETTTSLEREPEIIREREKATAKDVLTRELGANKVIGLRAQVADNLAGVSHETWNLYGGKIRDNSGDANPEVLLSRALDAPRFAEEVLRVGTAVVDPSGMVNLTELEFDGKPLSYLGVLKEIAQQAKALKKKPAEFKKHLSELLYAHREFEARKTDPSLTFKLTEEQAAKLEAEYQNNPLAKKVSAMLDAIRFSLIDLLVATGRISKETATEWKNNVGYIPFRRVDDFDKFVRESSRGGNRGLAAFKQIGGFKGSELASTDVIDNMSEFIAWAMKESMRNEASRRALSDLSLINQAEKVPNPQAVSQSKQGMLVKTYENGKLAHYYVPDPAIYAAFVVNQPSVPIVVKGFQFFSKILRTGVTVAHTYSLTQIAQDITRAYTRWEGENTAMMMARIVPYFFKNFAYELVGRRSKGAKELAKHGVVATYDIHQDRPIKNVLKEAGFENRSLGEHIFRVLEAGAKASDLAVREAIFKQTMRETGDAMLAESRAREIINFSRRGAAQSMDWFIRSVPFFNAAVRSMDTLLLAATGDTKAQKVTGTSIGASRSMFRTRMMTLVAIGFAYALMMQDDEEYQNLPDVVRDKNWVAPKEFREGLDYLPAFPLPGELSFFFKAIPDRIVQYMKYYGTPEERQALDILSGLFRQGVDIFSTPNLSPQAVRPFLEAMANYSFFLDRPLESQTQIRSKTPSERTGASTSKSVASFTKGLADLTGMEVSPIKLENTLRGMFGATAGLTLSVMDALFHPNSTDRPVHQSVEAQLSGAAAFMKSPRGNRFLDNIYKLESQVEQMYGSYTDLQKQDPEKAAKFLEKNYGLYAIRDELSNTMQLIRRYDDMAREIDKNTDYASDARRRAMNELLDIQMALAKQSYTLRRRAVMIQHEVDTNR